MADRLFDVQFEREFAAIDRFLAEIPDSWQEKAADEAMVDAALAVVRKAKRPNAYFRDRTGAARESIDVSIVRRRGRRFVDLVAGGDTISTGANHFAFLEFGNGRQPPAAPLRRASLDAALDGSIVRGVLHSIDRGGARKAVEDARRKSNLRR